MCAVSIEEFPRMPDAGAMLRRAVAGSLRRDRPAHLPETELRVRGVATDLNHLARFARVCGFRLAGTLPATYPHVLAFPLSLELMTRPEFPFPLIGLVHVRNVIDHLRPVGVDEPIDLALAAENLRAHDRGQVADLVVTATVDGAPVWRGRSTYLRRARGGSERPRAEADRQAPARPAAAEWLVPTSIGRAYASVSGDRNPIHTSTVAARLLGFPRRIAHGMWTKARCVAALEGRLPDQFTVDVSFKLPVLLPSTVAFSTERDQEGWRFRLDDARSGRPHLTGVMNVADQAG